MLSTRTWTTRQNQWKLHKTCLLKIVNAWLLRTFDNILTIEPHKFLQVLDGWQTQLLELTSECVRNFFNITSETYFHKKTKSNHKFLCVVSILYATNNSWDTACTSRSSCTCTTKVIFLLLLTIWLIFRRAKPEIKWLHYIRDFWWPTKPQLVPCSYSELVKAVWFQIGCVVWCVLQRFE